MAKIYSELARIQRELNAPKNLFNKFGNYYYRNAEGILAAAKPLLNGLSLIINDEIVMIGERYYVKATATLTDGNENITTTAFAREDETKKGMDGCQITGACSSYARKYALNALFMIDDVKDSDDDSLSPKNPANSKEVKPKNDNPAQVVTADKLPQAKAQEKKMTPVIEYLSNEKAFMGRKLGKTEMEMKVWFKTKTDELIKEGKVENVPWNVMTMEQAKALVAAIYASGDVA